jgi:hypothetical protein
MYEASALVRVQAGRQLVAQVLQSAGDRLQHVDQIMSLALGRGRYARGDQRDQHGLEVAVEIEWQPGIGQRILAGAAPL